MRPRERVGSGVRGDSEPGFFGAFGSRRKGLIRLGAVLSAALFLGAADPVIALAAGQALPCVLTDDESGNGYEYAAPGIGSFSANCADGDTVKAAVITLGDGCIAELLCDGEPVDFSGVVMDNGSYELRILAEGTTAEDADYGSFHFTVENDYGDTLSLYSGSGDVKQVENPPLTLVSYGADGYFTYLLPDRRQFRTTIPVGGYSSGALTLETGDGVTAYLVRRDGTAQLFSGEPSFREAGSYEILLQDNEFGINGNISYRLRLTFHIVSTDTLNLSHINAPMGFAAASAYLDGERASETAVHFAPDGSYVQLFEDGQYALTFLSLDGSTEWNMSFTRDTTPPMLTFSTPLTGEEIPEAVSFTPSEKNCRIAITRNAESVTNSRNLIAQDGRYHIEISDQTGNLRSYDFTVHQRKHWNPLILVIIPVLLLAVGGGIILYWHRDMRVL